MIDVYSARWNEKHKLLSLLWKLQGDLVADVVPTFDSRPIAEWLFDGIKTFTYINIFVSFQNKIVELKLSIVLET
jgi:hypothetical protein